MTNLDNLAPSQRFAVRINHAMKTGVEEDVDRDEMARICINTARELYDHYGAGDMHTNFLAFVTDTQFEMAEIEEWLDTVEGRDWRDQD